MGFAPLLLRCLIIATRKSHILLAIIGRSLFIRKVAFFESNLSVYLDLLCVISSLSLCPSRFLFSSFSLSFSCFLFPFCFFSVIVSAFLYYLMPFSLQILTRWKIQVSHWQYFANECALLLRPFWLILIFLSQWSQLRPNLADFHTFLCEWLTHLICCGFGHRACALLILCLALSPVSPMYDFWQGPEQGIL